MPAPVASSALDRLMAAPDPYQLDPGKDALFAESMREAVRHHRRSNATYDALCARQGFDEAALTDISGVFEVPFIFVNVLKRHELLSISRDDVVLNLTSSGTTGQKSQIFFDQGSLDRGLGMVEICFGANGLVNREQEVNYLIFAHDPAHAATRGTSYTDHYLTGFTARRELYYALRWDAATADWVFSVEETNAKLEAFAASGLPLRIIGFPAFLHRVVKYRETQGLPALNFGPESFVLTGGGWKTAEDSAIPKPEFRAEVEAALGIPDSNMRDGYGLVEHGVPYLECSAHRFHVPQFARAVARHAETLAPLPDGETGFLNLITPYLLSMPAISLLTSDFAVVRHDCPCGRNTATIEILGRAGTRKNKGCAITAAQLLK
jgi:phenylacetate-coenzyme A ligase PaaK-like adenylate-forming protein